MTPQVIEESNRKIKREFCERKVQESNRLVKEAFGVDLTDTKTFAFDSPFFKWTKFRETCYETLARRTSFREANAETVFSQLLRAGVNNIANNWYLLVPTNHEQVGANTVSTKLVEPYAPLHRAGVPRRVAQGDTFPEIKVSGLDIQIVNEKFGAMTAFERELFDDDQTGQIAQRARDIGDNMAILEDAWFFQRFIGAAGSYAGDTIPASQTKPSYESSWPWSTSLRGGGATKPASYGAFTSANLQAGHIALMNQLDLLGNKMLVNPNTLVVDPSNNFTAATLLNSEFYPTNVTTKIGGGAGTDSTIGTNYARNVMKGLYSLVVTRFIPAKAWALGESGKGIVFQRRDPLEVIQENPQSGMAFQQDVYRFRARARWEPDWVDPRFWWLGDDGTV